MEFVSANPTGPLTVASGRHAAYGDSLCRVLELAGHEVEREYYVNDYGSQVRLFGESIRARARGEDPPEGGYHGDYVGELAAQIDAAADGDPDELARRGVELVLEGVASTLERFRVRIDRFLSEHSLHEEGRIGQALDLLEEREHVYPLEGAVWLRTTSFGDDKDRVLMRSSGEMTYFATDIAYHRHKLERGYDRVIDVLGARPPRLREADGGRLADARRRPRALRDRDHAAGQPAGGRPAGADVQASGHHRPARRADRRHRGRRRALLPAPAKPRHDDRPRPRPGAARHPGQPGLLPPVRARADREHPAQGGQRRRRASRRSGKSCTPPSAHSSRSCSSSQPRSSRPPSAARPTGSRSTCTRPHRTSRPSTATARSSAPPTRSSASGSA